MRKIFLMLVCVMTLCSCNANNADKDGDLRDMKIIAYSLGSYFTNCYLVYDENAGKACLIDPAVYDDEIINVISSKGLTLEYIILTHGHFDHILGADGFRDKTGAEIAVYELETEYLDFLEDDEKFSADILLKDDDTLTFGGISLKVMHTPGHSKGSCCFICGDEKVMFSGDTLFKGTIGRYDLYGGDYDTLMESLQKIKSIKENYMVYPGHGDSTTLAYEILQNPYFR